MPWHLSAGADVVDPKHGATISTWSNNEGDAQHKQPHRRAVHRRAACSRTSGSHAPPQTPQTHSQTQCIQSWHDTRPAGAGRQASSRQAGRQQAGRQAGRRSPSSSTPAPSQPIQQPAQLRADEQAHRRTHLRCVHGRHPTVANGCQRLPRADLIHIYMTSRGEQGQCVRAQPASQPARTTATRHCSTVRHTAHVYIRSRPPAERAGWSSLAAAAGWWWLQRPGGHAPAPSTCWPPSSTTASAAPSSAPCRLRDMQQPALYSAGHASSVRTVPPGHACMGSSLATARPAQPRHDSRFVVVVVVLVLVLVLLLSSTTQALHAHRCDTTRRAWHGGGSSAAATCTCHRAEEVVHHRDPQARPEVGQRRR
jgi:hypothetical protein